MAQAAFMSSPFSHQPPVMADIQASSYHDLYASLHDAFVSDAVDPGSNALKCVQPLIVIMDPGTPENPGRFLLERICQCKLLEIEVHKDIIICVNMTQLPSRSRTSYEVQMHNPISAVEQVLRKEDIAGCITRLLQARPGSPTTLGSVGIHVNIRSPEVGTRQLLGLSNDNGISKKIQIVRRLANLENQIPPAAVVCVIPSSSPTANAQLLLTSALAIASSISGECLLAYCVQQQDAAVTLEGLKNHFKGIGWQTDSSHWLGNTVLLQHPAASLDATNGDSFFEGTVKRMLIETAGDSETTLQIEQHSHLSSLLAQVRQMIWLHLPGPSSFSLIAASIAVQEFNADSC